MRFNQEMGMDVKMVKKQKRRKKRWKVESEGKNMEEERFLILLTGKLICARRGEDAHSDDMVRMW